MIKILSTSLGIGLLVGSVTLLRAPNDDSKELPVDPSPHGNLEMPNRVTYEKFNLMATNIPSQRYTISFGLGIDTKSFDAEKKLLESERIPFHISEVADKSGGKWNVLLIGEYMSRDEAQSSRENLRSRFGITGSITVLPSR